MASRPQVVGGLLGSILAACAVAAPVVVNREGWVTHTYADPVGIPTACAGVTKDVQAGRVYSDADCEQKTAQALVEHGVEIAQCLPATLPTDTRAAFTSFAYNLGVQGFCASSVAVLARAGNLPAACAALRGYDKGKVQPGKPWSCAAQQRYIAKDGQRYCIFPGLVARRAEEQALCMRGLKP